MDKQYSVKFFTSLVESMQKVCRDFLDFEQAVDLSGYLCVEIDNFKKERYVLSELIQNTGDVISESYCTKAFKTLRKLPRESNGTENNDPTQTLMTNLGSSHTVRSSVLNRSCRSDPSTSRGSQNNSHTDSSKWNIVQGNPYLSSSLERRKRSIPVPTSSVSSVKRDRSDAYGNEVEDQQYTNVIPTNMYLTKPLSENASQTLNTNTGGSSMSMTSPSTSITHSSATPSLSIATESIRLPVNVTVKEEDDISFMVIEDGEHFNNSVSYGDSDTSSSFVHTQTNEKLTSTSPNVGDQENAHTARKMKGHVKLFQVSAEPQSLSSSNKLPDHKQTVQQLMLTNEGQPIAIENIGHFECRKCGYVFRERDQHKQHMQTYHPDKFGCDICDKSFEYKRSLWEHMQNHKGKKKFPCPYKDCDKSFARKVHMMDHMNSHSGIKPYSCDRCNKQFRGKYTLINHARHCTGIKE